MLYFTTCLILHQELSPSAVTEANAAVNNMQWDKAKETKGEVYVKSDNKMNKMGKYSSNNAFANVSC